MWSGTTWVLGRPFFGVEVLECAALSEAYSCAPKLNCELLLADTFLEGSGVSELCPSIVLETCFTIWGDCCEKPELFAKGGSTFIERSCSLGFN